MDISAKDVVTLSISGIALIISSIALWVAQFNKGQLQMTQPTLLCMKRETPKGTPKLFFRTLLFTTGTQGRVVENMFLKVRLQNETYIFDFWGHTESGKLTLGSGLFVGATGLVCDHHFNPREGLDDFLFVGGEYRIEVFATVVGQKRPKKLMELAFTVNSLQAAELIQIPTRELYLFWNAETRQYEGRVEHNPR